VPKKNISIIRKSNGLSSEMANETLWQQLLEFDGPQTARRANCQYTDNPKSYLITLLNSEYTVSLSDKQVLSAKDRSPAGFIEELCILAYLINSRDLPLAGKLTPPQALPGGEFFFRGPHKLNTDKLEKTFGQNPERLYDVMGRFAAKRYKFGDAAIELYILPRIPLTIVIWRGDDEFPARASVLFDQTAASQMLLDALWAAANLAIKKVIEAAENL
jgi:hypothetical protein